MSKKKSRRSLLKDRFASPLRKTAGTAARVGGGVLLLLCIAFVVTACATFFARPLPLLGILLSTVLSCFLMIPVTLLLAPVVRASAKASAATAEEQIAEQRQEIDTLKARNEELSDQGLLYRRKIKLLENLTSNLNTYRDVFKVCFRDYQQNATIKQRERFNEEDYSNHLKQWLDIPSKNYDEILSVMDCLVTYQRGVDLQNIKIAKVGEDSVLVSGIVPEYTTPPRFDYKEFFGELRHVRLDENGETKRVRIETDGEARRALAARQDEYKSMFEDSFMSGNRQEDDAPEIIRMAQDFIKVILQPIYKHVEFDDSAVAPNAVPLLDFLQSERELYGRLLAAPDAEAGAAPSAPLPAAAAFARTPPMEDGAREAEERAAAGGGTDYET